MKRGFLKSNKTLSTVLTASGIQPMKVHDHRRPPQIMKLSVGVVEDAGNIAHLFSFQQRSKNAIFQVDQTATRLSKGAPWNWTLALFMVMIKPL